MSSLPARLPNGSPDWCAIRQLFPALDRSTYLNTASRGALSAGVVAAVHSYYDSLCQRGDLSLDDWLQSADRTRQQLAQLIQAEPEAIAFLSNASLGMNFAAQLLGGTGGVITIRSEFPSVTLPWLQHRYPVTFVDPQPDGSLSPEAIAAQIQPDSRYLVIGHVQYNTGFRHNLKELGQLCRDRGLTLIVDATQSLGAFPIDVAAEQIDILLFSGYKWAMAGYEIAGLYIRPDLLQAHPLPAVGWRSAKQPNQLISDRLELAPQTAALELGHPPFAGITALQASLSLIDAIGQEAIAQRILQLTDYLQHQLQLHGLRLLSPVSAGHRSGIAIVAIDQAKAIATQLKQRQIIVSARGEGLRVSLHFYNNREDIDRLLAELLDVTAAASQEQCI